MNKTSGIILSEIVTAVIAVVVTLAVAFGIYVSHQRDGMVEKAQASIAELGKRLSLLADSGEPIICDESLIEAIVLANDYVLLTVKPTLIDESAPNEEYGAGVYIQSNREADGDDAFVTAGRLYEATKEEKPDVIRLIVKDKKDIEYSILVSATPRCANA